MTEALNLTDAARAKIVDDLDLVEGTLAEIRACIRPLLADPTIREVHTQIGLARLTLQRAQVRVDQVRSSAAARGESLDLDVPRFVLCSTQEQGK